eukprot:snap_masked-scaffold_61-processed-gene-0.48-mRNA-1 protein AED:0.21 eAED:0.30 QI:0/-1/0/1/-1/1/1/0/428
MGNCFGGTSEQDKKNAEITKNLKNAYEQEQGKIKILLLGTGESGKSTLFKQMKLLYTEDKRFSPEEKNTFTRAIYTNIITDIKTLLKAAQGRVGIDQLLEGDGMQEAISAVDEHDREEKKKRKNKGNGISPPDLADSQDAFRNLAWAIEIIWNNKDVQKTWSDRGSIQVQDALEYFMREENWKRISVKTKESEKVGSKNLARVKVGAYNIQADFKPSNDDLLRARIRTSGVVIEKFAFEKTSFEMHDVGGQRNERRKWIHSFDSVTTVLFVVAISEYNQVLYEDHTVSRQHESVELFKEQVNLKTFETVPFILFLNKDDLFTAKLRTIPFKVSKGDVKRNIDYEGPVLNYGLDYQEPGNEVVDDFGLVYENTISYLKDLYESQAPDEERRQEIYSHVTNSTSSENIFNIMDSCKSIILKANLANGGWM